MTNHGRWRIHAQNDDIPWTREIFTCKVKGWDGYLYEPIWIHPSDAEARGIENGDIVKMFNERGTVLGGALVWERIVPGAVSSDHGARADMICVGGPDGNLDRGGANNLISPLNGISPNCWGMATSGFLVEVQKVTMAEMEGWRERYPEAFAREYDPGVGAPLRGVGAGGGRGPVSKVFVFDTSICNGCYCCQLACKDEHCGNDWTPYAKPQPDTGQFWLKLHERVRGTIPKVKVHYVATLCNHCDDGACVAACRVEGAIGKRDDGLVVIDPKTCTGCMDCVGACSSRAIFANEELRIAQKCTGCAHLLDAGWKEPRCVDACPTGALAFVEETAALESIERSEMLHPEEENPRVFYLNIPKRFVAGTVYDPVERAVVRGATCALTGAAGGRMASTDGFGDFWFEGLEESTYSLEITALGFAPKRFEDLSTECDVNLGDIALQRLPGALARR